MTLMLADTFCLYRPISPLHPKLCTYFYVCLIDDKVRIFPNSYVTAGNRTHVSSVESLLRDLNQGCFTN